MHIFPAWWPAPAWLWAGFTVSLPVLLALDVCRPAPSPIEARRKTLGLALLALGFAGLLAVAGGPVGRADAVAFVTAWLIELALSVDNLFVFLLLFDAFGVHGAARARVLSWGLFGALVLRGLAIGAGVALIERFAWLFYVFGAFLLVAGAKLLWPKAHAASAGEGEPKVAVWLRRVLPLASESQARRRPNAFWLREGGRLRVTSLGVLLLAIEASDLVFAFDSVPAGFAITTQGGLLFASNALAILGLRSLFVALDHALASLRYLPVGLGCILVFIGGKMLLAPWVHVGVGPSLLVIALVLAAAVAASLVAADGANAA